MFLFLSDGGQSQCIWIQNHPTVQYIQVFLPAKPPLRKGFTREMIHTVGGFTHTHTGLSPPIRGFVKSARLWLYDNFEQCMKHYAVGVFFPHDLFFFSLYRISLTCHSLLTASSDCQRGMCLIACVHAECCIWTFESKLAAFYNGDNIMSFGCRFAQLHFWFFSFVFCCIFMILFLSNFVLSLGLMHLRILQLPEMRIRSVV